MDVENDDCRFIPILGVDNDKSFFRIKSMSNERWITMDVDNGKQFSLVKSMSNARQIRIDVNNGNYEHSHVVYHILKYSLCV